MTNLDEYESVRTHCNPLYVNDNNKINLDGFGDEHIPKKKLEKIIGNKNVSTYFYRIRADDSIMCGCVYIGYTDFMLIGKSLLQYTKLFSPNYYEKINKKILRYFHCLK